MKAFDELIKKMTKTADDIRHIANRQRRWEYQSHGVTRNVFISQLNEHGNKGWELVYVEPDGDGYWYVLKRELKEDGDGRAKDR